MIREEAIEEIKQVRFNLNCQLNGMSRFEEAFEMAIKALKQQTCEDTVSREAVLELFAQNADAARPYSKTWEEVKALPSVNLKRTGHWIYSIYGGFHEQGNWLCSHCNYQFNHGNGHTEYCPKCGYEMSEAPTEEVISEYDQR